MEYEKNDLAHILRSLRISRGITQGDLAQYLCINRTTYTKYEIDHTPSPETIIKIANFYSMTVDEMIRPLKKTVLDSKIVAAAPRFDDGFGDIGPLSDTEKRLITLFRNCDKPQEVLRTIKAKMLEDNKEKSEDEE